jgi:Fe-S cluster assembly iron-binding protein IscA
MTLYEPKDSDVVYEVEGIKFVIDKLIEEFADGVKIEYGSSYFGNGFSVKYVGERGYNRQDG